MNNKLTERIKAVIYTRPRLSNNGFNTMYALPRVLAQDRADLLSPVGIRQVETCMQVLKKLPRSRKSSVSSGELKLGLQAWLSLNNPDGPQYFHISNGALIVAALILGYRVHQEGRTLHAIIGIRPEDVSKLAETSGVEWQ